MYCEYGTAQYGQGYPIEVFGNSYSEGLTLSDTGHKTAGLYFQDILQVAELRFMLKNIFEQVAARAVGLWAMLARSVSTESPTARSVSTGVAGTRETALGSADIRSTSSEDIEDRNMNPEIN